jgi:MoxR-like ATPase
MSTFVGSYVNTVSDVCVASILSRQNAIVLGSPGWGKTAITRSFSDYVTGGQYSFTRIDPSTPPDVVRGPWNPAAMMESPPRLERMIQGTPYDPAVRLAIIDEIGRGNEATFDALLDTLDRLDVPDAPPVLATSNFMPSNERVAALIDRFGLWLWVAPEVLDPPSLVAAQLNGGGRPQVDTSNLPTWADIEDVHSATPGPNAISAIGQLISDLSHEAEEQGRKPHPRRVAQWTHVLYRVGVWHSGSADFNVVPDQAAKLLRYMWPAVTPDEQATWAQIAGSVVDVLGAAIEEAMATLVGDLNAIAAASPRERSTMVMSMTGRMQKLQTDLEALAGEDNPRVGEAVEKMNTWLSQVMMGHPVE